MRIEGRKSAFTLAEVLITIGIIGVVSALTIPTLLHNYKAKSMRTRLLRANSLIQNGVGRMVADEVNLSDVMKNRDYQVLRKYFKDGGCLIPKDSTEANYHNFSGDRLVINAAAQTIIYPPYCLPDGMLIWFGVLNEGPISGSWYPTDYTIFVVDINGWKTPPDRYGKDVFFWYYNPQDERVHPFGKSSSILKGIASSSYYRSCDKSFPATSSETGIGCTEEALSDEGYFKKIKL